MGTLEKIQNFLLQLQQTIGSFLKILIQSKYFVTFPAAQSDRIIIMGNGPSLNKEIENHLAILQKETTLAVNYFVNTPEYKIIQPNYYLISAPEFWIPNTNEATVKRREVLFTNLREKTDWDMLFFIPSDGVQSPILKPYLDALPNNIQIIPFNLTPIEGLKSLNHFCFNKRLGMPRPHNVIIPCILNTIIMGFKTIDLIGVEHSWLAEISVTEDNVALVHQKHFYDVGSSQSKPMQMFQRRPRKLHEILHKFVLSFRSYHVIEEYAQSKGTKIYNCTKGSYIDAFKRRRLGEELAKDKN